MSIIFSSGLGVGADWLEATSDCLDQLDSVSNPKLGFIYVTDAISTDLPNVIDMVSAATGLEQCIGTVGGGVCGVGREVYDRPAVSVMLGDFPNKSFSVFESDETGLRDPVFSSKSSTSVFGTSFSVVHGDPSNPNIAKILENSAQQINSGFFVGGLACSQSVPVRWTNKITGAPISGVIFEPETNVVTRVTQGCSPITKPHVVTRAEANIIYELDNKSAVSILANDLGEISQETISRMCGQIFVGLVIPNSDTADYLVRNLVGLDVQSGLIAIGDKIENGDRLVFCKRDENTALADMMRMLESLKRGLNGSTPKAGLYYSCIGRGRNLFSNKDRELLTIREVLGDFPLTGFFANGEICRSQLYTHTGVLTLFI